MCCSTRSTLVIRVHYYTLLSWNPRIKSQNKDDLGWGKSPPCCALKKWCGGRGTGLRARLSVGGGPASPVTTSLLRGHVAPRAGRTEAPVVEPPAGQTHQCTLF